MDDAGVKRLPLPPRSPNLNCYAERWVRSVKEEVLSRLILFGEASLRHALTQYVAHFHHERNHQGRGNVLLFPTGNQDAERAGPLQCRERPRSPDRPHYAFRGGLSGAGASSTDSSIAAHIERGF